MKNFEKYAKQIDILGCGDRFSVTKNGEIKQCMLTNCEECIFNVAEICSTAKCKWLFEEYKEPKTKGEQMLEELGFIREKSIEPVIECWTRGGETVRYYNDGCVLASVFVHNVFGAVAQRGKELFNEHI